MIKTFSEVESYLSKLPYQANNFEHRLSRIQDLLYSVGNPQDSVPVIHIAGTSGKGSTAYYSSALLQHSGYKVGLVVSPHVTSVAERTQINGNILPEQVYCKYFTQFIALLAKYYFEPTYIEFLTVFSYWVFAQEKVDYMVIEVGIGGRLDSTNVMQREDKVCVITDIGLDHTDILGDTVEKIATEKAGIIMRRNTVVMHQQDNSIIKRIKDACNYQEAQINVYDFKPTQITKSLPTYQQRNWQLAHKAVAHRLKKDNRKQLSCDAITASLGTLIPGRFEQHTYSDVMVILDAAHNPQKLTALTESISKSYPNIKPVFLVAFGKNKQSQIPENLGIIAKQASSIIITSFELQGGFQKSAILPQSIKNLSTVPLQKHDKPSKALNIALDTAKRLNTILVVTGSFYLLDNLRPDIIRK